MYASPTSGLFLSTNLCPLGLPAAITPPASVEIPGCTATFAELAFISRVSNDAARVFIAFVNTTVASVSE